MVTASQEIEGKIYSVLRADSFAERIGAYYVRTQAMAVKHHIPLEEEFDDTDASDETHYLVVLDDVLPIATARLFEYAPGVGTIGRVVVLPEYRGKGIGTLIMKQAEEWGRDLGFDSIVVESRDNKTEFYEKCGYRITDAQTHQNGAFVCVLMEKKIRG